MPWRLTAIEITRVLGVGLAAVSTTASRTVWPGGGPLARPVTISDDDVCISTSDDAEEAAPIVDAETGALGSAQLGSAHPR